MTMEKLTEEERTFLSEGIASYHDAKKALRIIDAQAADLAEARAECERLRELLDMCSNNFDAMVEERNRADVAESKLAAAEALLGRVRKNYTGAKVWEDIERSCSACKRARCDCFERECDKCHWPGSPNCRAKLARRGESE